MMVSSSNIGRRLLPALLVIFLIAPLPTSAGEYFEWERLPDPPPGLANNGASGLLVNVHNNALLVTSGIFFPIGTRGSLAVHVLLKEEDGSYRWVIDESSKLSIPLVGGISASSPYGVIRTCGCDSSRCYPDTYLIKWLPDEKKIEREDLPPLPAPLEKGGAVVFDDVLYVAGGSRESEANNSIPFHSLDLSKKSAADFGWEALAPAPSGYALSPLLSVQDSGQGPGLYMFVVKTINERGLVSEVVLFDLASGKWTSIEETERPQDISPAFIPTASLAFGAHHILALGTDNQKNGCQVMAFHTITRTWTRAGEVPGPCTDVSAAEKWGDDIIVLGTDGEGPALWKGSPKKRSGFGAANYAVLGLYLAILVGMGVYFSRREKSTEDYFTAGGRVPWWAAGLSLFGTAFSTIAFMSVPAKSYATDLTYLPFSFAQFLAVPVVIAIYLPIYRRLRITTSYEYLEMRFNVATRMLGALMFLLFQFSRFAIVLYLPAIALSLVTGINLELCIVVMGALSIVYTVMGGIEAVIWTDVLQVVVLMGGALLCLALIVFGLDGGVAEFVQVAGADGKLRALDFTPSLSTPSIWVVAVGAFAYTLIYAGSDQTYVQRYQTTSTEKEAAKGLWVFGLVLIPSGLLFYGLGTVLYVFFKTRPEALDPTLANADAIFPYYIVSQLPPGVAGLLIAGLFAASMSSLDSSMNSASAVITTDFYRRIKKDVAESDAFSFARRVTVAVGLAGTGFALIMSQWHIPSLWDEFLKLIGLLAGGLGGLFLLGILSKRANGTGAIVGLIGSGVVQYFVQKYLPIHLLLYTFTGFVSCMAIGYAASLAIPEKAKERYTLAGIKRDNREG